MAASEFGWDKPLHSGLRRRLRCDNCHPRPYLAAIPGGFDNKLAITSKSLEILFLQGLDLRVFEISCPNLKELTLCYSCLIDQPELAIASESLKRLHIGIVRGIHFLQVSCTKLERLELYGYLGFDKVELMNLPSSVNVYLVFKRQKESSNKEIYERLVKDILHQVHHVNKLKLRMWLIEVLSGLEAKYLFSPVLGTKCLTLYDPGVNYQSGIACVLRNLPMLETLVIIEDCCQQYESVELSDFQEKYPDLTVFNFPVSHLKNIVIIDLQYS